MNANRREWLSPARQVGLVRGIAVRDASRLPVRRGVPGELRRPPFCERARSMESCLLACVRLSPLTKVPRGASSVEGMYRPQLKPPDQGRVVGCGPSLLGQAARAKAALGDTVAEARRSRGSGGDATTMSIPTPTRQHSRAFALFAAENKNASQAGRLCDCPGDDYRRRDGEKVRR